MDSDHEELYLQKIKSYVFDEDKVVTTAWLSKTLDLDLQSSKQLLQTFLADSKCYKDADLVVTYVLKGILCEDDLKGVCIVGKDELESKKKLFKTAEESVYSVQKGTGVDFNLIGMVDMLDIENPPEKAMVGAVIGRNCIRRNLKEKKPLPVVNRMAATDKTKASHLFTNTKIKTETKSTAQSGDNKTSKPAESKPQPSKNPKGSLANMFSNMPAKKAESPKGKSETKSESPKGKSPDVMDVDDDEDTEVEDEKETNGVKKDGFYDSGTDEEAKKIEEKNKKAASGGGNKRRSVKRARKDDKGSEQPQKKRKRIIDRNDSDSDDMFADDDDKKDEQEAVIESDDETVYKKAKTLEPRKGKKRSQVDKTYMDEDGYMVTKKEWVYESASEGENEENKVNNRSELKAKKSPDVEKAKETSPTKGMKGKNKGKAAPANQPTLMSFFKKK